jgi:glycoside/pentoside/hexuronide:cation symporter, GPH family
MSKSKKYYCVKNVNNLLLVNMVEEFKGNKNILLYCLGMAGWSIMINTISVMLIYFYLPPKNAGLPELIPQVEIFGIVTLFAVILASGRLIDAITDPVIAWLSDSTQSKWGRRVPFMTVSLFPSLIFCTLLFFPPENQVSSVNYLYLFLVQAGFYISLTLYIVPYNALMPELAHSKDEKLYMSMVLSFMFVAGMIVSSQIPLIAKKLNDLFDFNQVQDSYQWAIILMSVIAFILMSLPLLVVDEKRYCQAVKTKVPLLESLRKVLSNKKFLIFLIADASFFVSLAIISSGILYYVKVLLGLSEELGSVALAVMIGVSLLCYPLVMRLSKKFGKKILIIISFLIFSFLFAFIAFMGKINISPMFQLYFLALVAAFPIAVLGILPYNLVADIAQLDAEQTGSKTEGMYFAIRTFSDKFGQTLGVSIFAVFTIFGKDPGNDLGIRYTAWTGFAICLFAALMFRNFKE